VLGNCCVVLDFVGAHQWAQAHFLVYGAFAIVQTKRQVTGYMGFDIDQVREVVERVATPNGLEVVEVELRGGGKARMLRIVIDKPSVSSDGLGGVTHEDCANLSREVGTILDVEDALPGGSYVLEVSSPGLDRKLSRPKDYERFVGSRIKLTTRVPVHGNKHFEGRLQSFQNGLLTLEMSPSRNKVRPGDPPPQKLEIELAKVEKANLVPEF
jgi:ribosome maturation factor RimP